MALYGLLLAARRAVHIFGKCSYRVQKLGFATDVQLLIHVYYGVLYDTS